MLNPVSFCGLMGRSHAMVGMYGFLSYGRPISWLMDELANGASPWTNM